MIGFVTYISFLPAEVLALTIHSAVCAIALLAIDRPPSNSTARFLDKLRDVLRFLNSALQPCLRGDFNIDILKLSKSVITDYLNMLAHLGIECCIQSPRREELRGSNLVSSCIKHINVRVNDGEIRFAVTFGKIGGSLLFSLPSRKGRRQRCRLLEFQTHIH